jgi:hypothetical protein
MEPDPRIDEPRINSMINLLDTLRETFTLYLAAGMMFSVASVWAAVKAVRSSNTERKQP